MAGMLGDDFVPTDTTLTEPADTDLVKYGASWIRDTKVRLKLFASRLFNLETGDFKDSVIRSASLKDVATAGTYTSVTVNAKGQVTAGTNPVIQQTANLYRAIFDVAGAAYETPTGVLSITGDNQTYSVGDSAFHGAYPAGWQYVAFAFTVPDDVRRIKAICVGGGGGGSDPGGAGGGGAEAVEAVLSVSPGDRLTVLVGNGASAGGYGGTSGVSTSAQWIEAAGGSPAVSTTGGGAGGGGAISGSVLALVSEGSDGTASARGSSGSYLLDSDTLAFGAGGLAAAPAIDGLVMLEWVV